LSFSPFFLSSIIIFFLSSSLYNYLDFLSLSTVGGFYPFSAFSTTDLTTGSFTAGYSRVADDACLIGYLFGRSKFIA
jgi:hypothetical protein